MVEFRKVTDEFSVAPQIALSDVARAAEAGFKVLINNRPDGESPEQPSSAEMSAAAQAASLDYVYIPVRGGPTPDQVDQQMETLAKARGPVLAFCRSGTRSIVTWSLGQAQSGRLSREAIVNLAAGAGYDLSGVIAT